MTVWQYALLRAAYQAASPSQREKLYEMAKIAETGDRVADLELRIFAMELIRHTERPRSAAPRS
jgi:hypothetical protein